MFTGIIQTLGEVVLLEGPRLVVRAVPALSDVEIGESVATNGICLTVVRTEGDELEFGLSEETFARTTCGEWGPGRRLHLERALRMSDRLGGHFVQGHVDTVGVVVSVRELENSRVLEVEVADGRYLVEKGSIAIDGVSLTVVNPTGGRFELHLIPHTLEVTNLGLLQAGDRVNVEFDMLAKYVEGLVRPLS